MMRSRLVAAAAVALAPMLTCGGQVDLSACEWQTIPIDVPGTPPFQVTFGTTISDVTPDPLNPSVGLDRTVFIMLTRDPNGCPTTYFNAGNTVSSPMCFLELTVTSAADGPSVGQFPIGGAFRGFSTAGSGCVASSFSPENFTNTGSATSGVIAITKYLDGSEVAGSFSVEYSDGSTLSGVFDVPYCTGGCL